MAEVRDELAKQLKVLEQIGAITHFDEPRIEALRHDLTARDLVGEAPPRPKPTTPPGLTNEATFEQYGRMLEVAQSSELNYR